MRPTFAWTSVPGAVVYDLYLRDVANRIDQSISSLTATTWIPAVDFSAGLHQWWVRAKGMNGVVGTWSSAAFVDVGGAPSLNAIPSSSNHTPLFSWNPVDGAVRYILHVNRIDVPIARILRNESITATQFRPTTALPSGTYRAWIQAVSSSGAVSLWSVPINFTVTQSRQAEGDGLDLLNSRLTREPMMSPQQTDATWRLDEFFFDMNLDAEATAKT